jgi:hypothetical protein
VIPMDNQDLTLRNLTYRLLAELGRPPSAGEAADQAGVPVSEMREVWRRLHEAHALVLDPALDEIRMANPFSAVPTAHRVEAGGRPWYANCAWDAFGICAALHVDGLIETTCMDCGDRIAVEVRAEQPGDESLLFHCLMPAEQWWDDIVFT